MSRYDVLELAKILRLRARLWNTNELDAFIARLESQGEAKVALGSAVTPPATGSAPATPPPPDASEVSDEELRQWATVRCDDAARAARAARAALAAREERDAYKRAKAENDERFMLERDAARAEVERLRRALADCGEVIARAALTPTQEPKP